MTPAGLQYVFGPVPSRRLGRSLGVDLVPFKTCPYDCVYCQLGRTTDRTLERREYVPLDVVLAELRQKLSEADPAPDHVSLGGSGEPTLHSGIGTLIRQIKQLTDVPVAVLTSGALLWMPEVRNDLMEADIVLPSLCAPDGDLFQAVNRGHPDISFQQMVDGLARFTEHFSGQVWLEVFLLGGLTAASSQVGAIADLCRRIAPHRVQLNTISRPPAEDYALPIPETQMQELTRLFDGPVEVICDTAGRPSPDQNGESVPADEILALLGRHPCTIEDIAVGLSTSVPATARTLEELAAAGSVHTVLQNGEWYYRKAADSG